MSHVTRDEKMAMIRLAAVMEKLHLQAHDSSAEEEVAVSASIELGKTFLRHFPLMLAALREAGKTSKLSI